MAADGIGESATPATRTISSSQPTSTKPRVYILSLPTEILYEILSLVCKPFHGIQVNYDDVDGKSRSLAQPLILRQVSSKFRRIVSELDFWYKEDFDFMDLVSVVSPSPTFHHKPDINQKIIKIIFADENFTLCLGSRKTSWKFSTYNIVCAVLDNIPLSVGKMRTVKLYDIRDQVDIAIDRLRICKFITKLSIIGGPLLGVFGIDLNLIGDSCPFLQELCLNGLTSYKGSMANSENLQKMYVSIAWLSTTSVIADLIPERSAETLTTVTILNARAFPNINWDLGLLGSFINLNYLRFEPVTRPLTQFLVQAKFRLKTFWTYFTLDVDFDIEDLLAIFSAKCLENLDQFTLNVYIPRSFCASPPYKELSLHEVSDICERIIQGMTKNFQSVRILTSYVPLKISWCHLFARMTNLEILHCNFLHGVYFQDDESSAGNTMEQKIEYEERLNAVFAGFVEKPHVEIRMSEELLISQTHR